MKVGIVGLGLIGGSLAKAIRERTAHRLFLYDRDPSVMEEAELLGLNEKVFTGEVVGECDVVILALYPEAALEFLSNNANAFKKGAVVTDCVGVKREICELGGKLALEHGFVFIGGHPLAGTQFTGFAHSRATLFKNAAAILTPPDDSGSSDNGGSGSSGSSSGSSDERKAQVAAATKFLTRLYTDIGCSSVVVTTPADHDARVAYTSQLPHAISNAYVKNATGRNRKGFSGGSYKDMSRTARVTEELWIQLYLQNAANLVKEIDEFTGNLAEFRAALVRGDAAELRELLRVGREKYCIGE